MGKRYLGLLACAFTVPAPAFATAITINASSYAVGTNLTNAFSGVTLGLASLPLNGGAPTFKVSSLVVGTYNSSPLNFNTLGPYTDQLDYWYSGAPIGGNGDAIYMAFTKPVYSVTATDFSPYTDTTEILALNSAGTIIGGVSTSTYFCWPLTTCGGFMGVGEKETYSSTKPITAVLIGSSDSTTYITSISFSTVVPEPPSIAIFASGLIGMVLIILRRRRREPAGKGISR